MENLVTKTASHHRVVNTEFGVDWVEQRGGLLPPPSATDDAKALRTRIPLLPPPSSEDSRERNHREFALSNQILIVHEIHLAAALA